MPKTRRVICAYQDHKYGKLLITVHHLGHSAKSMALMPEMDLLRMVEVCFRMDLVGEFGSLAIIEDCFRIDCGFLVGERGSGLEERSFLATMLFRTMSTGTGLIMTLELFFRELVRAISLEGLGPQLISFEDLMISSSFFGEASTFSLKRCSRFLMPLLFIILVISSSCFSFLLASSSIWLDFLLLLLLARLATKELSSELQMLPSDWFRAELSFFLSKSEESEWSRGSLCPHDPHIACPCPFRCSPGSTW